MPVLVESHVLRVQGNAPHRGRCLVELVCRRDRLTFKPPRRRKLDESAVRWAAMDEVYFRASNPRVTIEKAAFGSYRMSVEGFNRKARVRRLR